MQGQNSTIYFIAVPSFIVESCPFLDGRVLLTDDKDFGELVVRERRPHRGVVLVRLSGTPHGARCEILSALFKELGSELIDAFTVVDGDGRIRVRSAGPR